MNANSQLEFHPDAESLNAFVEQALAERERGPILAHLAGCSRCRQVVYLAQEAAAGMEMEAAAPTPVARPAVRHESRFRSWRFAWGPALALAAIAALAFFVHVRRVEIGSESAKVTPPPNGEGVFGPAMTPGTEAMPSPAPTASARPARGDAKTVPTGPEPPKPEQPSTAAAAFSGGDASVLVHRSPMVLGGSGAGYSALGAAAEYNQEPVVGASQKERARVSTAAEMHAMTAQRETTGGILTAAAPPPEFDASPAPSASFDASGRHGAGGTFTAYMATPAGLPSGLPAVSTATAQHCTLAVDQAGAVFVSEDAGRHWERVARQWTGRVVTVRVQVSVLEAGPTPGAVFEIVNDRNLVWVSADGRTWTAQRLPPERR